MYTRDRFCWWRLYSELESISRQFSTELRRDRSCDLDREPRVDRGLSITDSLYFRGVIFLDRESALLAYTPIAHTNPSRRFRNPRRQESDSNAICFDVRR